MAKLPFHAAIGHPAALGIEGAAHGRQSSLFQRDQRRRLHPQQPCGGRRDGFTRRGQIIGDVVNAGRATVHAGQHAACNIVNMDATEHMARQIDPRDRPGAQPIECGAAGAIDAGQAEHAGLRVQRLPLLIGQVAPAATTLSGHAFINPGTAGIAINTGGGQIADPFRRGPGQCVAMRDQHRIAAVTGGRD